VEEKLRDKGKIYKSVKKGTTIDMLSSFKVVQSLIKKVSNIFKKEKK